MGNIKAPVLSCNGVEIDGGNEHRILGERFAHPVREKELFQFALNSFIADGEFEWVGDGNVFLLKNVVLG